MDTNLARDHARLFASRTAEAEVAHPNSGDPATNVHKELHHVNLWKKACTRIAFAAVTDTTGGMPLASPKAAASLRAYWLPIFPAKVCDPDAENRLLRHTPDGQLCNFNDPPGEFRIPRSCRASATPLRAQMDSGIRPGTMPGSRSGRLWRPMP
jgi:hypothetical protein